MFTDPRSAFWVTGISSMPNDFYDYEAARRDYFIEQELFKSFDDTSVDFVKDEDINHVA